MTVADTIEELITRMLKNSIIISPRFEDYRVKDVIPVQDYGIDIVLAEQIQEIVNQAVSDANRQNEAADQKAQSAPEGSVSAEIQGQINEVLGVIRNPAGFVGSAIRILPAASLAFLAQQIAQYVFAELTRPGGLYDVRWKRQMELEFNAFLDRQTQRNTQIGTRQVIIQSQKGFLQANGAASENTLRQIRDGGVDGNRLAQVDLVDHSKGLF